MWRFLRKALATGRDMRFSYADPVPNDLLQPLPKALLQPMPEPFAETLCRAPGC